MEEAELEEEGELEPEQEGGRSTRRNQEREDNGVLSVVEKLAHSLKHSQSVQDVGVLKQVEKIVMSSQENMKSLVEKLELNRKRSAKVEEEKPVLTDKMIHVKDDNNTIIDAKIRNLVGKNPNSADPTTWWSQEFKDVAKPELGEGLCLGHLGPGMVNPEVILKIHDRKKVIPVKELLSSNSGYGGTLEENIQAKKKTGGGNTGSYWEFAETKSLKNAAKLEEVVEAGLNYQAVTFMVRSWDWSGVAMMRVAHACRYFKVRTQPTSNMKHNLSYCRESAPTTLVHRNTCWNLSSTEFSRNQPWLPSRISHR